MKGAGGPFGAVIARDGEVLAEGLERGDLGQRPDRACGGRGYPPGLQGRGGFFAEGRSALYQLRALPDVPRLGLLGAGVAHRLRQIAAPMRRRSALTIRSSTTRSRKAPQERSLPIEHHPSADAKAVFEAWLNKPDRIPY